MAVLKALRQVPGALGRNPLIFAVVAAFGLIQAPQLLAQTIDPLLASLLSLVLSVVMILVIPFVQAGLVGMADEALDGRTEFGTFLQAGKQHYLSVLGAYLVVVAISSALGIVGFFGSLFGGLLAFSADGTGVVALALIGLVLLVVTLAYLVVIFFLQFYGQAIVLDGASAVDGLKHSVGLVRRNLASTAGYTLVVMVVSGIVGVLAAIPSVMLQSSVSAGQAGAPPTSMTSPTLSLAAAAALTVVYAVGTALVGGTLLTYSVAFYRELRDRPTDARPA